ncbi:MAG: class I SAM-dependent methyltransferase [Xanthomonadales bacterium]|nr:class I SAM-dependent methyltransferase [Xanthomonadales bacterium]
MSRLKVRYRALICPLHQIVKIVPRHASVMDIGCGAGTLLWFLEHYRSPQALAGLEIDPGLANEARLMVPSFAQSIKVYDGRNLPDDVSLFDFVILNDVFHHIERSRQAAFLAELKDRMKPSAHLILKDIDADRRILVWVNRLHDLVLNGEIGHERGRGEVRALLEQAGFKIRTEQSRRMAGYPHFTLVASA